MVELFEQDERQNNRQSSKGNQLNGKTTEYGIKQIIPDMRGLQNI